MRVINSLLTCLFLVAGLTANSQAQEVADETVDGIESKLEVLNTDIGELERLFEPAKQAETLDREFLVYRQDERSFRLLEDFNDLTGDLDALEGETPRKKALKNRLIELSEGVGNAILNRISDIRHRISRTNEDLDSLSGVALISAQAYINMLEDVRISYYQALVTYIESREMLGVSSEPLKNQTEPDLYIYVETLTGRIEYTGATLKKVKSRVTQNPGNADLKAAQSDLIMQHRVHVERLESMIPVLDALELDSSKYKTVMLEQSKNISVNFFSIQSLESFIKNGWSSFRSYVKKNAANAIVRMLLFIAILMVFRMLSRLTRRFVLAASNRSSLDTSQLLKNILVSTSGGLVMGIGFLVALSQIGISLAPMLAGLGVAGFIVGFALQDTLGNFAAGAMILIYRPYDVDDFVEVTGASGLVRKMNLVSTTITTFDNQTLVVPNSKIWGVVIKNITAQKERRVDLEFGIGYGDDIEHAEKVLTEIVSSHEKVLKDPAPNIKLHTLGDSSVNFIVRPWTRTGDYWEVYWDIMREVKLRFDREGISIPFPQRDVHLYSESDNRD